MSRMVVTRGATHDVAQWVEDGGGWHGAPHGGAPPPPPMHRPSVHGGGPGHGRRHEPVLLILLGVLIVGAAFLALLEVPTPERKVAVIATIADVAPVHAGVKVGMRTAAAPLRLLDGEAIETDEHGRARARLDGGVVVLVDRASRVVLRAGSVELERGRAFIEAPTSARVEARLAGGSAPIAEKTAVALSRSDASSSIYVARGETTLALSGKESVVHGGETARIESGAVRVLPERNFDDWTAGLAAPWSAGGAPRRALAEASGRGDAGGSSGNLATRAVDVRATLIGEAAETRMTATFFNAGDSVQVADVRLAIPPGAIVSSFATIRDGARTEATPALASRTSSQPVPPFDVLEWAGESWVRASIPAVNPGQTLGVEVTWVEWLPVRDAGVARQVDYRFPMTGPDEPTTIGELSIRVDASALSPLAVAMPAGATRTGDVVTFSRSDARPTSDFVVGFDLPRARAPVRAFVAPSAPGDDGARTILVRAEAPAPRAASGRLGGVDLVVVVDRSSSVEPAMLEASRAFVRSLVDALGPADRVAVLGADTQVRPIGPRDLGPADNERRAAIRDALATPWTPGGATDLGAALEQAADRLPADAPAGLVLYVGDGWATWGDLDPDAIRARLARRARGAPRVGAVALGPVANRLGLAALVRGTGPLLEVADSQSAAQAATELLATSVGPAIADVRVDLGPGIERVYPRGAMALRAGETFSVVGKLRGDAPRTVRLEYRDGAGAVSVERALVVEDAARPADVRRRWASARAESIALAGTGREAATHVALGAGLLTPWTALVVGGVPEYPATPLGARVLDLSSDVGFGAALATVGDRAGVIASPDDAVRWDPSVEEAMQGSAGRILDDARAALRACRDARAALRPTIGRQLAIRLTIDGEGRASKVALQGAGVDAELERCVAAVVVGLAFPSGAEKDLEVSHLVTLPELEIGRRRTCSDLSRLPVPQRRGAWQLRLERQGPVATVVGARRSCELGSWTAQRALLELVLLGMSDLSAAAPIARQLDDEGESAAATLLRREAMRRVRSADELARLRAALLDRARLPAAAFVAAYGQAKDDAARMRVVAQFLAFAPHDRRLLDRLLALSAGDGDRLRAAVRRVLDDPFVDAALVASAAEALRAAGDADGSRRAFEEIVERSPRDPWARAFLGDRLRAVSDIDGAAAVYAALEALDPGEPAATLRSALAHAGAGRTDLALRLLGRLARTGGRNANRDLARVAGVVAHVVLREALSRPDLPEGSADLLQRQLAELPPVGPAGSVILVQAPGGGPGVAVEVARGPKEARDRRAADAAAPGIGLWIFDVGSDLATAEVRVSRAPGLPPGAPLKVRVVAIASSAATTLATKELELPLDGRLVRAYTGANGAVDRVEVDAAR